MTGPATRVELPADPSSVALARRTVREACAAIGVDVDAAVLCTSEIVTNALLHGAPPIELEVVVDDELPGVRVSVRDSGTGDAVEHRRPLGGDTLSGRGLTIVDAIASRWGADQLAEGNLAWFELVAVGAI